MPGTNLTQLEAAERAALLDVERYELAIDLTRSAGQFGSVSRVWFACRTIGATSFIDLVAPQVNRIVLNGRELDPATHFADSRITLPDLAATNELVVEANCAYTNSGEGLHRFVDPADGETYLYSQLAVADCRRLFAVFEQPDLKATFAFTVTAPAAWQVISNEPATSITPDAGTAVHIFPPTPPISCYLAALIAGPYARWESALTSVDGRTIPLGLYARQSLARHVDAEEIFDITRRGFEHYEPIFDFPYPYTKYDQLFVPEFNAGAMENVGAVTITEAYVFHSAVPEARIERRAITILHELAHMWFGDLVTMRWWNDLWLNESFAEYASHVAAVANTRWQDAWTTFATVEKTWAYRQDQLPSTHPIMANIRDLQDVEVNFDGITYAKGASVLRQLVAWVGQEAFQCGIAAYFKAHAWGTATLADLLHQLELTSGRDLSSWSDAWLTSAGVNALTSQVTVDSTRDGQANQVTALTIRQSASAANHVIRPHRLAAAGYDLTEPGKITRTWRQEFDIDSPITTVELAGKPTKNSIILINDGDLAYAKIRLDPASQAAAIKYLGEIDDPLARAVIWGSLWDATRDAELPAADFINLVLDNIGQETNSSTRQTLLSAVNTALTHYVAPANRIATTKHAANQLGSATIDAAPGSDAQLQLVQAFAAHATSERQLEIVTGLLSGEASLPGRAIDTDLTWELLAALVRNGQAGTDRIEAQLRTDTSASGQTWAARLRAMIPSPEAKARAWKLATSDLSVANHIQNATIRGFMTVFNRGLLRPYVEPYFELLERTWAQRSYEMASNIVEGLYPALLGTDKSAGVLAATDTWLEQLGSRTPALQRLVIEARDGVIRAKAAQKADH